MDFSMSNDATAYTTEMDETPFPKLINSIDFI